MILGDEPWPQSGSPLVPGEAAASSGAQGEGKEGEEGEGPGLQADHAPLPPRPRPVEQEHRAMDGLAEDADRVRDSARRIRRKTVEKRIRSRRSRGLL